MKAKPLTVVLRIAVVLFSVALATVYVACQTGNGDKSRDPNAAANDPQGDPPLNNEQKFLPGSKSDPYHPKPGTERPDEPSKTTPRDEDLPGDDAQFLPGSKRAAISF